MASHFQVADHFVENALNNLSSKEIHTTKLRDNCEPDNGQTNFDFTSSDRVMQSYNWMLNLTKFVGISFSCRPLVLSLDFIVQVMAFDIVATKEKNSSRVHMKQESR